MNALAEQALFAGYSPDEKLYDEMFTAPGVLRPHWERFAQLMGGIGSEELGRRWDQVERLDPSVGPEKFRQQIDNVMRHYQMATYLIDASLRTRRQMLLDERVLPGSSVRGRTAPEFKGQVPPPMAGMAPPGGMPSANNLLMDVLTNGPASRAAQMPSPSVPPAPQGAPVSPASGALPTAEDLLRQVQGGRP